MDDTKGHLKEGQLGITALQTRKWKSVILKERSLKTITLPTWPFNYQNLIGNSPYCLSYSSYDGSLENLVLDQLMIP